MNNRNHFTIAIIKEARIDENRTPFTPKQIQTLITNFPNLNILVQPSKNRCFKDEDYFKAGAKIEEDISRSDIIFGVKEVEISSSNPDASEIHLYSERDDKVVKSSVYPEQFSPYLERGFFKVPKVIDTDQK